MSHFVLKHEIEDVLGNRLEIIPLSSQTAEISIFEDDREKPTAARVILTLGEIQEIADAARRLCGS